MITNNKDIVELSKYTTTRGYDIFGYPKENLANAILQYQRDADQRKYSEAEEIFHHIKLSITIEELAFFFKKALFESAEKLTFVNPSMSQKDIIWAWYCEFLKKSKLEVEGLMARKDELYAQNWKQIVPDEDDVQPAQLGEFYNSNPFPTSCLLLNYINDNLVTAYRALPVWLAQQMKARNVFDYGGNSGVVTSVMATLPEVSQCILIEENESLRNFAQWRDKVMGIEKVSYFKESYVENCIEKFRDKFDIGVCTEVLEHVYDVEKTVYNVASLIKPGGLLYQTTSFGLYPEPSHLKKNVKYAGNEDELMKARGLYRVNVNFPLPLIASICVYQKRE